VPVLDDDTTDSLTRTDVLRARGQLVDPSTNGHADKGTATAALCSECKRRPARSGCLTCGPDCTSARARRMKRESTRRRRDAQRPAAVALAPPSDGAPTSAPTQPQLDWRHLAGIVEAMTDAGLRVALRIDGVELTVSRG
jgi:hypothetical protein